MLWDNGKSGPFRDHELGSMIIPKTDDLIASGERCLGVGSGFARGAGQRDLRSCCNRKVSLAVSASLAFSGAQ